MASDVGKVEYAPDYKSRIEAARSPSGATSYEEGRMRAEHERLRSAVVEASKILIAASEDLDRGWEEFTGGNMEVVDKPLETHTEKYEVLRSAVDALNKFEASHAVGQKG